MSESTQYNELEDLEEGMQYPGEKPSKLKTLKAVLSLPITKCVIISFIVIMIYLITIGAVFWSAYAIGKNVALNSVDSCDTSDDSNDTDGTGCEVCPHFWSIDDFDTEPIPDIENDFDTIEFEPLELTDWPDDVYHPLVSAHHSPPYVFRYDSDWPLDRNDPIQRNLLESNEYQLKLDPERFIDKETGIEQLQEILSQFLGPYISSIKEPKEEYWYELQYEKHGCGGDYSELRVRNYFTGKNSGTASSSVNKDIKDAKAASTTMIIPGVDVMDGNEMKLEQDIHPCYAKYNRKVKIKNLPYGTELTCDICHDYYPQVFLDTTQFEDAPLELHSNKTFWNYSQKGYLFGNTTKFKTSFNIAYDSEQEALSNVAVPNHSSEWSIRIYSFDDGYGVWDEYVLTTMGEMYSFMLEYYGSHGEDPSDCSAYEKMENVILKSSNT